MLKNTFLLCLLSAWINMFFLLQHNVVQFIWHLTCGWFELDLTPLCLLWILESRLGYYCCDYPINLIWIRIASNKPILIQEIHNNVIIGLFEAIDINGVALAKLVKSLSVEFHWPTRSLLVWRTKTRTWPLWILPYLILCLLMFLK